ncbi:unnamed protein product [Cuscuta campestris]|uniref:Uncharacterized protein n=1 Tax=Cuscuta campestris TaxID=132261 RepID=A0A484N355_9ASTE|nr:unnamed protein product [Cuscuta campestris]
MKCRGRLSKVNNMCAEDILLILKLWKPAFNRNSLRAGPRAHGDRSYIERGWPGVISNLGGERFSLPCSGIICVVDVLNSPTTPVNHLSATAVAGDRGRGGGRFWRLAVGADSGDRWRIPVADGGFRLRQILATAVSGGGKWESKLVVVSFASSDRRMSSHRKV